MDEETKAALIAAGWSHSVLLDSFGRPYWAWQRGTKYSHGHKVVRPYLEER